MADTERELPASDFELEITDLEPRARPPRWRWRRLTPGQRKLSLTLTAVLFALVVSVILASTSDVRSLLARTLFPVQSTAVSNGNNLAFYLRGNPSWGRFIIDGRPVEHLPVIGRDQPLILTAGRHTIVWKVAPFKDQTCVFTVAVMAVSGPCVIDHRVTESFVSNQPTTILSFFASLNDLPSAQRAALLQQLQTEIAGYSSSEVVRPGELYAVSEQQIAANPSLCYPVAHLAVCYARATQPLRATLSAQLDSSTSSSDPCMLSRACSLEQQDCRALCNDAVLEYTEDTVPGWNVEAIISLHWSYATLSGQVIARDQPASALRGTQDYRSATIHMTRDRQGWHISLFPSQGHDRDSSDPVCDQAGQDIYGLSDAANGNQQIYIQSVVNVQQTSASGCLVVIKTSPGTVISSATPIPDPNTQLTGYCLVRFGVVLTINNEAHMFWPALPRVDTYERVLASQALATLPAST